MVPQLIEWPDNYNENEGFRFEEIITGNGSMLNTPLFYGFYSSKEVYNAGYLMAEAYFYTILAIFVLTLLLQSIRYENSIFQGDPKFNHRVFLFQQNGQAFQS